jgi:hypothetical protein
VPETGVGGYENTLWDLVFNLLGALAAVVVIGLRSPAHAAQSESSDSISSERP